MKRSATYRQGWNGALRYIRRTAACLPDEWREHAEPLIAALCRALWTHKPRGGTNAGLGHKSSAPRRAIVNWRKAGCPLELGKSAVLKWLATRRSVPPRTEKRFGD